MKWEYTSRVFSARVHGDLDDLLNKYGSDGWELSQMLGQRRGQNTDENHGHGWRDESEYFLVFKRMILQ